MQANVTINGRSVTLEGAATGSLLDALRAAGYHSVKRGCDTGDCGNCAVLLDGKQTNSCHVLLAQVDGCCIQTAEGLGEVEHQGWKTTGGLHPLQQAFIELGAIQCGFCTPAMLLAGEELLERKGYNAGAPEPITEAEAREALSGILCRCTGYVKPVQAILATAARLRGEEPTPAAAQPLRAGDGGDDGIAVDFRLAGPPAPHRSGRDPVGPADPNLNTLTESPVLLVAQEASELRVVGKSKTKVDAAKLAQGKPAYTDDVDLRGMLIGKIKHSPVAHARIKSIDVSKAKALPGVAAVLTYKDIPRVAHSTAGQTHPLPSPLDTFSLDSKVRFVGDRVALVAAETEEIARQAVDLIEVEYEELPAIIDPRDALKPGAVLIHDEPDYVDFAESDRTRNLAAHIFVDIGNVDQGFADADHVFEGEFLVPKVQHVHLEPHVVITYWDEDDRLVVRTSTQVPFHARRILAPVLGLPVKRIRVIKPRVGGGFGGKQEVLVEDAAGHLTIATGRPVKMELTREEEFVASRSRHPMIVRLKTGVKSDGAITANEMSLISDTGAYGSHALTVAGNTGHKSMALYVGDGKYRESPNIRFTAQTVYTNTVPSGAFRGYGVPQGVFAVELQMERIARALELDPIEFRLKNALRAGEAQPFSKAWSEGREPVPEYIETCALEECARRAAEVIGFREKRGSVEWHAVPGQPHLRRGVGLALAMQGTAIPFIDMGGASLKMNDDGSFNLLVGATDIGTGSDTILAQMVAETVGCEVDDIIVYSSDTDFTPFDVGAYASSTTFISGGAATRAAQDVAQMIREVALEFLGEGVSLADIRLADRKAIAPDGRSVTLEEIALRSLHSSNQRQIMAVASFNSPVSPPPFTAQFAEVTVDTQTGEVRVQKLVTVQDSGVIVNPIAATGQVEGAVTQQLGYALTEEMPFDDKGRPLMRTLQDYHIFTATEMPELVVEFVQTVEPTHPFGVKAVGEVPMDGVAPAIVNAIYDAVGAQVNQIPATPERVWRAMNE
jgi:putative selenate reductase molybdopterin-binding subunit